MICDKLTVQALLESIFEESTEADGNSSFEPPNGTSSPFLGTIRGWVTHPSLSEIWDGIIIIIKEWSKF